MSFKVRRIMTDVRKLREARLLAEMSPGQRFVHLQAENREREAQLQAENPWVQPLVAENPEVQPLVNNSQYTDAEIEAALESLDVSSIMKNSGIVEAIGDMSSLENMSENISQGIKEANILEGWRNPFGNPLRRPGNSVGSKSRKNKSEEGYDIDDLKNLLMANYKLVGGAVALFIVGAALMA